MASLLASSDFARRDGDGYTRIGNAGGRWGLSFTLTLLSVSRFIYTRNICGKGTGRCVVCSKLGELARDSITILRPTRTDGLLRRTHEMIHRERVGRQLGFFRFPVPF